MQYTLIQQRRFNSISRRQLLRLSLLLGVAAVATLFASDELKRPKFHGGAFSNGFSSGFDIDRTEYPLAFGVVYVVTAHDESLRFGEDGPSLTVWKNRGG